MPPCTTGALTYFGRYERNVYKDQLLQNVAKAIAMKGPFLISFNRGTVGADSFEGASIFI